MTREKIYKKKKSGRYYEIGQEFFGFPSNGIWLVIDGSQNCIVKLDDIIGKDISCLKGLKWVEDTILDVIQEISKKPHSSAEMANAIAGAIYFREDDNQ